MDLNKFYTRVLSSLNVKVSQDGYTILTIDNEDHKMKAGGKSLVLPTSEHINSYLTEDEHGKIIVSKVLYNPLNENVINGDTLSLQKTKDLVESRLNTSISAAGSLLLLLSTDKKFQEHTSMELNKFLVKLNTAQNTPKMKVVDDRSIELWNKLFINASKEGIDGVKIFIKKRTVVGGVKYNRLTTVKFPIYDLLLEADKTTPVLGVTLRPKDITVFKLIYQYLITALSDDDKLISGSNDGESPGFVSLFTAYLDLVKKPQKVIKALKGLDQETYDVAKITISIKPEELTALSIYKSKLLTIPSENDTNRNKVSAVNGVKHLGNDNSLLNSPPVMTDPNTLINQHLIPTAPLQMTTNEQPTTLAERILYGNRTTPIPSVTTIDQYREQNQPVQQYLPQHQLVMTPQNVVPGGVNTLTAGGNRQQQFMPQNMYQQQPNYSNQGYANPPQQGYVQQQPMYPQQGGYPQQGYPQQRVVPMGAR